MAASYLRQIERDWLSRHLTGVTAQTPVGQLKRMYYSSYLGGTNDLAGPDDLETRWLDKYIRTNLGTPSSNQTSTLWKEIVVAIGKTASPYMNDNKITFYLNAV